MSITRYTAYGSNDFNVDWYKNRRPVGMNNLLGCKKRPFSAREEEQMRQVARTRGFTFVLVFDEEDLSSAICTAEFFTAMRQALKK